MCMQCGALAPFLQGGRRFFSRRENTALVGGPGNMAVYRHILVVPPTAKTLPPYCITAEKRKTAYRQKLPPCCITAEKIPPCFGFTASAKVVTAKDEETANRLKMRIPPACVRLKNRCRPSPCFFLTCKVNLHYSPAVCTPKPWASF